MFNAQTSKSANPKVQTSNLNFKESLFGCKVFLIFGTLNLMIGPFRPPLLNELKH